FRTSGQKWSASGSIWNLHGLPHPSQQSSVQSAPDSRTKTSSRKARTATGSGSASRNRIKGDSREDQSMRHIFVERRRCLMLFFIYSTPPLLKIERIDTEKSYCHWAESMIN